MISLTKKKGTALGGWNSKPCEIKNDALLLRANLATATAAASTAVATAPAATAAVAATAAAVSATTTAAAVATTTTATASAATITTAAAWRTSFTGTSFIHSQGSAFDRLAIEFRDRFLRVRVCCHRDKGEAARFAGELILHQRDLLHRSRLSEKILQICFGRVEGKISYV